MQPEDQKSEFQQPKETNYFSPAPLEGSDEPSEAPDETAASTTEPGQEAPVSPDEPSSPLPSQEPVQWQAPEYLHHEKNPLWFIAFGIVVIALTVLAIFLIKSWTFAILIPVMAAALIAYSHRPPRVMDYVLSGKGIYINDTLHPFAEFKGFGVIHEEAE